MTNTHQEVRTPGSATRNLYDLRPKPVPFLRNNLLAEMESQGGDALRGYLE